MGVVWEAEVAMNQERDSLEGRSDFERGAEVTMKRSAIVWEAGVTVKEERDSLRGKVSQF